tara:strand:- start:20137 stop:21351 length:1215 start_codon:yes stop_codon:yes gene_type:complete
MGIVFDLFGVHIAFVSIILILFLAWLFWPRKFKKVRKMLIRSAGVVLLVGVLLAAKTYWPYSFDKNYLKTSVSEEIASTPLKNLADSIDFHIGVAIGPASDFKTISREFNSVVGENDFKPGKLLVDAENWKFDFSKADKLVAFAEANNMRMRGHTLIWGKFPGMTYPAAWGKMISESSDKKKTMEDIMSRYIQEVLSHFKGKVPTWDVVNEPMHGTNLYSSIFTETLGEEYLDLAFKMARKADPEISLFLNEQINDYDGPSGKAFLELLKRLIDRKVPIDGVGLQCHHLKNTHDIDALKRYMRSIAELGLKVEITELDVRLLLFKDSDDPYAAQGKQFEEITKLCIDEPACNGLTLWGLTDGANWMDAVAPFKWKSPNAPNIYDEEMNRKPAYLGIWNALKNAQ